MTASPAPHVAPPVLLVAAALAQTVFARGRTPTRRSKTMATLLAAGSAATLVASAATLRSHGTTVDAAHPEHTTQLVTSGPYAVSRNPVYLALTGLLVARAIGRRCPAALLPAFGFAAVIGRTQIPREERALRKRFGKRYDRYRVAVPRWLGRGEA